MAGLGIIINRSGIGPVVPEIDPRLHEGSLVLLDVMHSAGAIPLGVPANMSLIPNIAHEEVSKVLGGSPAQSATSGIFKTNGLEGTIGKLERTGRGGIHAIVTQNALAAGEGGASVVVADAIRQYLFDNPTNDLFMSNWTDRTRASLVVSPNPSNAKFGISNTTSALANYKMFHISYGSGINSARPNTGANFLGARAAASGGNSIGPQIANVGSAGWTGNAPSNLIGLAAYGFNVGSPAGFPATQRQPSGFSSEIFYSCYLEDLTVSGRTYAEVDAIDLAAFELAFGVGGRYNGDTYTSPSTIA